MSRGSRWFAVALAAAAAIAVAGLGMLSTDLGPWYRSLREPAWKPDDAWFGPAWTLIYALTAASAVQAWQASSTRATRDLLLASYAANAFLNVLWSLLFFRLRRPDWALVEVGALWASIAWLIVLARRCSAIGAWLLAPYLAWVTFAAALNWAVVQLNRPFGSV